MRAVMTTSLAEKARLQATRLRLNRVAPVFWRTVIVRWRLAYQVRS
jgi:hypothetical protein